MQPVPRLIRSRRGSLPFSDQLMPSSTLSPIMERSPLPPQRDERRRSDNSSSLTSSSSSSSLSPLGNYDTFDFLNDGNARSRRGSDQSMGSSGTDSNDQRHDEEESANWGVRVVGHDDDNAADDDHDQVQRRGSTASDRSQSSRSSGSRNGFADGGEDERRDSISPISTNRNEQNDANDDDDDDDDDEEEDDRGHYDSHDAGTSFRGANVRRSLEEEEEEDRMYEHSVRGRVNEHNNNEWGKDVGNYDNGEGGALDIEALDGRSRGVTDFGSSSPHKQGRRGNVETIQVSSPDGKVNASIAVHKNSRSRTKTLSAGGNASDSSSYLGSGSRRGVYASKKGANTTYPEDDDYDTANNGGNTGSSSGGGGGGGGGGVNDSVNVSVTCDFSGLANLGLTGSKGGSGSGRRRKGERKNRKGYRSGDLNSSTRGDGHTLSESEGSGTDSGSDSDTILKRSRRYPPSSNSSGSGSLSSSSSKPASSTNTGNYRTSFTSPSRYPNPQPSTSLAPILGQVAGSSSVTMPTPIPWPSIPTSSAGVGGGEGGGMSGFGSGMSAALMMDMQTRIQQKDMETFELRTHLDNAENRCQGLVEELNGAKHTAERLQLQQREDMQRHKEEISEVSSKYKVEITSLETKYKDEIGQLVRQRDEMANGMKRYAETMKEQTKEIELQRRRVRELEEKYTEAETVKRNLLNTVSGMEAEIKEKTTALGVANEEGASLRREVKQLSQELRGANEDVTKLKAKGEEMQKQLDGVIGELEGTRKQLLEEGISRRASEDRVRESEEKIRVLTKDLEKAVSDVSTLEKAVNAGHELTDHLRGQIESLSERCAAAENAIEGEVTARRKAESIQTLLEEQCRTQREEFMDAIETAKREAEERGERLMVVERALNEAHAENGMLRSELESERERRIAGEQEYRNAVAELKRKLKERLQSIHQDTSKQLEQAQQRLEDAVRRERESSTTAIEVEREKASLEMNKIKSAYEQQCATVNEMYEKQRAEERQRSEEAMNKVKEEWKAILEKTEYNHKREMDEVIRKERTLVADERESIAASAKTQIEQAVAKLKQDHAEEKLVWEREKVQLQQTVAEDKVLMGVRVEGLVRRQEQEVHRLKDALAEEKRGSEVRMAEMKAMLQSRAADDIERAVGDLGELHRLRMDDMRANHKENMRRIRVEMTEVEQRNKGLVMEVKRMTEKYNDAQGKIDKQREDVRKLKDALAEAVNEYQAHLVSSRAINEENARYRAQLEEKDELIELLKQQVGSLTRTVVDMEKQNKSLTSQTEEANALASAALQANAIGDRITTLVSRQPSDSQGHGRSFPPPQPPRRPTNKRHGLYASGYESGSSSASLSRSAQSPRSSEDDRTSPSLISRNAHPRSKRLADDSDLIARATASTLNKAALSASDHDDSLFTIGRGERYTHNSTQGMYDDENDADDESVSTHGTISRSGQHRGRLISPSNVAVADDISVAEAILATDKSGTGVMADVLTSSLTRGGTNVEAFAKMLTPAQSAALTGGSLIDDVDKEHITRQRIANTQRTLAAEEALKAAITAGRIATAAVTTEPTTTTPYMSQTPTFHTRRTRAPIGGLTSVPMSVERPFHGMSGDNMLGRERMGGKLRQDDETEETRAESETEQSDEGRRVKRSGTNKKGLRKEAKRRHDYDESDEEMARKDAEALEALASACEEESEKGEDVLELQRRHESLMRSLELLQEIKERDEAEEQESSKQGQDTAESRLKDALTGITSVSRSRRPSNSSNHDSNNRGDTIDTFSTHRRSTPSPTTTLPTTHPINTANIISDDYHLSPRASLSQSYGPGVNIGHASMSAPPIPPRSGLQVSVARSLNTKSPTDTFSASFNSSSLSSSHPLNPPSSSGNGSVPSKGRGSLTPPNLPGFPINR